MRVATLSLLVLSLAPAAAKAADCDGCKDHPQVTRFPGFSISHAEVNDSNTVEFQVADGQKESKVGKSWLITYSLNEGAKTPSCAETARNYENAFQKVGGRMLWRREDWCESTYSMPVEKSERWFALDNNVNGNGTMTFTVLELAPPEKKVELAGDMLEALNKKGFVALYGIHFDPGQAEVKPDSEAMLSEVAKLLSQNGGLKLIVADHTDTTGQFASNLELSRRRADAVTRALVGKGVAPGRLISQGLGPCAPIATNEDPAGRLKNTRVELVKQ